ncbi:hypothetical protein O9993_07985 [Vibrio lentus]|nr:hypothetical protein [Vibrio lentus]
MYIGSRKSKPAPATFAVFEAALKNGEADVRICEDRIIIRCIVLQKFGGIAVRS